MSKKAIKKSFRRSAEYSATLVFGVLFLVSSMYSLPNFSVTKSANSSNDTKNLKTTNNVKLDSTYKKYCESSDYDGFCNYISINNNSLLDVPSITVFYTKYSNQDFEKSIGTLLSIRAPPLWV